MSPQNQYRFLLKIFDNQAGILWAKSLLTVVFQLENHFTLKNFNVWRWINLVSDIISLKS